MMAARVNFVVGGELFEKIYIGRQTGAREQALEEIVAEDRVLRDSSLERFFEGIDVVDPFSCVGSLAEEVLIHIGDGRRVRVHASRARDDPLEVRALRTCRQGRRDPGLQNRIALDDASLLGVEARPVQCKIFSIAESRPKTGGPEGVNTLLTKAIDRIDTLFNSEGSITGLSTGFTELDNMTSGLQPADLIIVAGRPSMGKTTFAMNLVENAVMRSDKAVLVFSLEMPGESLIMRMLSSLGRIDQTKVRSGRLGDEDWPRLTSAVNMLNDRKLFIDDTAGLSPMEMRTRARRIVREQYDGHGYAFPSVTGRQYHQ